MNSARPATKHLYGFVAAWLSVAACDIGAGGEGAGSLGGRGVGASGGDASTSEPGGRAGVAGTGGETGGRGGSSVPVEHAGTDGGAPPVICAVPVPTESGGACGEGSCHAGERCVRDTSDPACVDACECDADVWVCGKALCPQPLFSRSKGCNDGATASNWIEGPAPSSLWLTDRHLYFTHATSLFQAAIPCGAPAVVGTFGPFVRIIGTLPEGILLFDKPLLWLFRPGSGVLERRATLHPIGCGASWCSESAGPSILAGEVHVGSAKQHVSFAWASPEKVLGELPVASYGAGPPVATGLVTVGVGFTVQTAIEFTYKGTYEFGPFFIPTDGAFQTWIPSSWTRSVDGHLFHWDILGTDGIAELSPDGTRRPTGLVGVPRWVDECQIIFSVPLDDSPEPRSMLGSAPRGGGKQALLSPAPLQLGRVVAGPSHIAWVAKSTVAPQAIQFRTR